MSRPPELPLVPQSAWTTTRDVTQVLRVSHGSRELTMQVALSLRPEGDVLVALGPFGQRVFTLRYDAAGVHAQTSPYVPQQLPPRRVWADVQLALWPLDVWRHALAGGGWRLEVPRPGVRQLFHGRRLVTEIRYDDGSDGWTGSFSLSDFAYGYTLQVRNERPAHG
ncbi:MAG TPA: DUF3261 domain-containing protein [Nevskiaceae bacterium]